MAHPSNVASWILIIALASSKTLVNGQAVPGEVRIVSDLLRSYGQQAGAVNARPVFDSHDTLTVDFSLVLIQILDFDEMNQRLKTLVWKKMSWMDHNLRWNPDDYEGVTTVSLPATKIWTPDIILFNTVGAHSIETSQKAVKATVTNDGKVLWIPPVQYQSSCVVNMEAYPFDEQECTMSFGSWMYDSTLLDINFIDNKNELELHNYHESTEWKLTSSQAVKKLIKYPCCEHPFVDVSYSMKLERLMTFHMRLFLVPTPILAVLSLGIFWIPPNRPDRTAFGLTLFSSFFLLLILVKNSTPPTSKASIGAFYISILKIVFLAIVFSILSVNCIHTTRKMPECLKRVTYWFGFLVCSNACRRWIDEDHEMKDTPKPDSKKWRTLALIFDRICFIAFIPLLTCAFVYLFPEPGKLFMLTMSTDPI